MSMLYAMLLFQFSGMILTAFRHPRLRFSLIRKYCTLRLASGKSGSETTLIWLSSSILASFAYCRAWSIRFSDIFLPFA